MSKTKVLKINNKYHFKQFNGYIFPCNLNLENEIVQSKAYQTINFDHETSYFGRISAIIVLKVCTP